MTKTMTLLVWLHIFQLVQLGSMHLHGDLLGRCQGSTRCPQWGDNLSVDEPQLRLDCQQDGMADTLAMVKDLVEPLVVASCSLASVKQTVGMVKAAKLERWGTRWIFILPSAEASKKKTEEELEKSLLGVFSEKWRVLLVQEGKVSPRRGHAVTYKFLPGQRDVAVELQRADTNGQKQLSAVSTVGKVPDWMLAAFKHPTETHATLSGRLLVTAANQDYPWFGLQPSPDDPNQFIPSDGVDVKLLTTLAKSLNFNFKVHSPPGYAWGTEMPNGTFTGLTGAVQTGLADISADQITISATRRKVIDYSDFYFIEDISFVTRSPTEVSRVFAIIMPFSREVWLCILASLVVSVTILYNINRFEHHHEIPRVGGKPRNLNTPPKTLLSFLFDTLKSYFNEGSAEFTGGYALLSYAIVLGLCNMTLISLFSATLTAYMSFPGLTRVLNSVEDLAEANEFSVTIKSGTIIVDFFKTANAGTSLNAVWRRIEKAGGEQALVGTPPEGIAYAHSPYRAFVDPRYGLRFGVAQDGRVADFHIAKRGFFPNMYGIQVQKGSPLKPVFDKKVGQLLAAGLPEKWATLILEREMEIFKAKGMASAETTTEATDGGDNDQNIRTLTMDDLQGAFFIWAFGLGIASLSFVMERLRFSLGFGGYDGASSRRSLLRM